MNAVERPPTLEHDDVKDLTFDAWLDRLLKSVDQPIQDGKLYPGFPDEHTQKAFVGSAFEDALTEGYRFYKYLHNHLDARRFVVPADRYLDFGCGWGRISRFFLRDFERGDMIGVDIDDGMVAFCQTEAVPGGHFVVRNDAPLPFADASFRLVTAYSVFTHLPEALFRSWLRELLRVTAPGGLIAFTVEPERFLDFISSVDPETTASPWHAHLHASLDNLEDRRRELKEKGLTYLPTGGGAFRPPESYGDTVVTPDFVRSCLAGLGELIEFVDEPNNFWQAVVIVRRHRWKIPFRKTFGL